MQTNTLFMEKITFWLTMTLRSGYWAVGQAISGLCSTDNTSLKVTKKFHIFKNNIKLTYTSTLAMIYTRFINVLTGDRRNNKHFLSDNRPTQYSGRLLPWLNAGSQARCKSMKVRNSNEVKEETNTDTWYFCVLCSFSNCWYITIVSFCTAKNIGCIRCQPHVCYFRISFDLCGSNKIIHIGKVSLQSYCSFSLQLRNCRFSVKA